jgi:arylsulfatase A-like enzyme
MSCGDTGKSCWNATTNFYSNLTCNWNELILSDLRIKPLSPIENPIMLSICHSCRELLLVVATLLVLFSFEVQNTFAAQPTHPNVILMMADDLGWGDTGYNGSEVAETPNLDSMAKSGLALTRFYAQAPVCSPTRGSCLTGRHPYRYGITNANTGHLPTEEITLQTLLKEAGYATGHFGKWHLGTLTHSVRDANRGKPGDKTHYAPPWERDFDVCFSTESKVPTYDSQLKPENAKRTWWDAIEDRDAASPYGTYYWNKQGQIKEDLEGDDSKCIMDRALAFIEDNAKKEKQFLAVIWFHAPHLPVVASEEDREPFAKRSGFEQSYFGCIRALDREVGRLRAKLRELNIAGDTLLFFCSDNGPEGGDKDPGSAGGLRGRKRSLFEGGVRVPGIVEWPGKISAGSTSDAVTSTTDYLPTILDLMEIKYPSQREVDGVSFLPLLKGETWERPRPLGFQSGRQATLVGNTYKLVVLNKDVMLFDISKDKSESEDLAKVKPDVTKQMQQILTTWQKSCAASAAGDDYSDK